MIKSILFFSVAFFVIAPPVFGELTAQEFDKIRAHNPHCCHWGYSASYHGMAGKNERERDKKSKSCLKK